MNEAMLEPAPTIIHGAATLRRPDAELLDFEAALEAANDAVVACEQARRDTASNVVDHCDDTAEAALDAVVRVVACLCDVAQPDANFNKTDLARWATRAIVDMKATAVRRAVTRSDVDYAAIGASLDLINTLNRKLGGNAV